MLPKLLAALLACAAPHPAPAREGRGAAKAPAGSTRHSARSGARAAAQTGADNKPEAVKKQGAGKRPGGPKKSEAAERPGGAKKSEAAAERARREVGAAVTALREVAEDARSFDDLYESARAQSAAAYLLWPHDGQAARALVRRAWEATHAPGAEGRVSGFGVHQDPGEDARHTLKEARALVIEATAKHDPRLAEEFMRELDRDLRDQPGAPPQGEQPTAAEARRDGGRGASPAEMERIRIARALASAGDFKAAAGVVAPLTAKGPTRPLVDFIMGLRGGDTRAADALYLRLIEATGSDPGADANDVLTLSTLFVSPRLNVVVGADGSPAYGTRHESEEERRAPPPSPELRAAFYAAAANVLLRPRAAADGGRLREAGALYFTATRLLPFFEREAAQHAPALHAHRAALAAEMEGGLRERVESSAGVRSLSLLNPADPLAHDLDLLGRAADAPGRDFARLRAVANAARRALWERARGLADGVEDPEMRRGARFVIAVRQVAHTARSYADADPAEVERAADFVRASDVPPEVRAAGLAQAAVLAAGVGEKARAAQFLTEAAALAREAERGDRRVTALALVALSAARAHPARRWELLPTLAAAAAEADELSFGALNPEYVVGRGDGRLSFFALDTAVNLPEVYAAAARLDAVRALAEARVLKDEALRAECLLHAARAALGKGAAQGRGSGR